MDDRRHDHARDQPVLSTAADSASRVATSPLTGFPAPSQAIARRQVNAPPAVAHRLTVGAAADAEEQRADAVAARVVAELEADAAPGGPVAVAADPDRSLRRTTAAPSGTAGVIGTGGGELSAADSSAIASHRGAGTPLSGDAKSKLSRAMGTDLGHIRLHTGPEARALNQRMSAVAFTSGSDIFFRDGHPDLASGAGRRLIAHELAHAVGADGGAPVHRFDDGRQHKGSKKGKDGAKERKPGFFGRLFGRKPKPSATAQQPALDPAHNQQVAEEALKQKAADDARAEEARKQKEAEQKAIDARTKDFGALQGMKLDDLARYTAEVPDWAKHSSMSGNRPAVVSQIVGFSETPESGAFPYLVGDLVAIASTPAALAKELATLSVYGRAVQNDPFPISRAKDVAEARAVGADLKKLIRGFRSHVLAAAMTEDVFDDLRAGALIDDVIDYYKGSSVRPIFQAEDGEDFAAYILMRQRDNVDPRTYQRGELAPYLRNFHRFEARLLDRLIVNFKDTSKTKPLTLVLHTAVDHNGAFHRDPELFRVVDSAMNNTLIIEGGQTLEEYTSQISPLARKYGVKDKIDQVMFAGHGNAQSMELAGGVKKNKKGKLSQFGEDVDVEKGSATEAKTLQLFDEVLANMDQLSDLQDAKQPHRRLLFNACLTNSNIVDTALTGDDAAARKQIRDWISDHMSLATSLNARAKDAGADVQALGANASITQVELIDSKGGLDLYTEADKKVTASKLEYMQDGTEPTGVLRAAVEAYGNDAATAIAAMQARIKAPIRPKCAFDDIIVRSLYEDFLRYKASATRLNNLRDIAEDAEDYSHLQSDSRASLTRLHGSLLGGYGEEILDALIKDSPVANLPKQGLMIRIARLALSPKSTTKRADLMARLDDPSWTVKSVIVNADDGRYLDVELLQKVKVLPRLLSGPPTRGKLVLALAGLLSRSKPPACKTYLQGLVKSAVPKVDGLPEVPAVPEVTPQPAPRDLVPGAPAVPGRPKVDEITDQRPEYPQVLDLPEVAELPAVAAPEPVVSPKEENQPETQTTPTPVPVPEPVMAPGRPERPKREAVPDVPAVDPYFEASLKLEEILGGASTVRAVLKLL